MENPKKITLEVPTIENITGRRSYIPTLFGIALLFFYFNFCELSCQGQRLAAVSGFSLATGTTIEMPKSDSLFGFGEPSKSDEKEMPSNIWAIFALLAALGGLVIYLIKHRQEDRIGAIAGGIGVASLLLLNITLSSSVKQQGNGMLVVNFLFPYWAAFLCFGAAGAISFLRSKQNRALQPVPFHPSPPNQSASWSEPTPNPAVQNFNIPPPVQEIVPPVLPTPPVPEAIASPAPPVLHNPPANPSVQHYATPVHEQIATFRTEANPYTSNNAQNAQSSNIWIWALIIGSTIFIAAVLVFEFMPSKSSVPEKVLTQTEPKSKPQVDTRMPITSKPSTSTPVTESAVSIGYVKTKTGSTLRMRKEPSESSEILIMIPNGSPVIILGYDDHFSVVNGENGKWCKIKYNEKVGWAWGSFIVKK